MCNIACIKFVENNLSLEEVKGKRVLEIGARNINGSVRSILENKQPQEYIGIDIRSGTGVDMICDVNNIQKKFGSESFDIIIATEIIEHVKNWRGAIWNMKAILKRTGTIFITTRSKGLGFHGFPFDFWRFEVSDMKKIFTDFNIIKLEKDPLMPGVFIKAVKHKKDNYTNLFNINLYSILKEKKVNNIKVIDLYLFLMRYFISKILPAPVKQIIKKFFINNFKNE